MKCVVDELCDIGVWCWKVEVPKFGDRDTVSNKDDVAIVFNGDRVFNEMCCAVVFTELADGY